MAKIVDTGDQVVGNGKYMRALVSIDAGKIGIQTHVWTHVKFAGYTGGVLVTASDADGKIIYKTDIVQHGVDGQWIPGKQSDRWVADSFNIDPQIAANTDRIDVWVGMAPRNRLKESLGITIEDIGKFVVWLIKTWLESDSSQSGQDPERKPIQTTAQGLTATSQRPAQPGSRPVVYEHSNYGGRSQELGAGRYGLAQLSFGNDTISSVKVPAGWRITLYQHAGFNGASKVLTADTPALPEFNDQTSSIVVEGGATASEPRKKVALRANNGQYVCAEGSGGREVVANRNAIGPWETFTFIERGNGHVALQANNGQYVCAEGSGGREVVANRNAIGPWETFTLIERGNGYVALQASNGQYVCAEGSGGREVVANRNAIGPWETFTLTRL